jgi:glycosyltransferase involved in cell wall biosynthesis
MKFAVVINQMIGPHVNGSQVACWAVVRHLLREGHEVYVCPMLERNEVTGQKDDIHRLEEVGARFHPFLFDRELFRNPSSQGNGILGRAKNILCRGPVEDWIPWLKLRPAAREALEAARPDAVMCYDFTALAATHKLNIAPRMGVVVDLWHMVVQERWQARRASTPALRRPFEAVHHRLLAGLHQRMMMELMADCEERIEFAPHHAEWLRRHGLSDVRYLQTPVEDPLPECKDLRAPRASKPTILMIGDLTNVATRLGMELFAFALLPELERRMGADGFEVRVVGGGRLPAHVARRLERPSVKMIGRVSPPHAEFLGADVVLVPTPVEIGMRVRIAVAFGYGCCVVTHAANGAGIPEMKHEVNALLGADALSLARQVELVCKEPGRRKDLGRNARAAFEEYFSAERAAARLTERLVGLAAASPTQHTAVAGSR